MQSPQESWPLLPPSTLGGAQQVKQVLRGAVGGNEFTLQCAVTVTPQQLTVVGITALGLRAFTLKYDGQTLNDERAPQVPALVTAAQLINDLQLAFWPFSPLQTALSAQGWELSEPAPGTRRLRRQGKLIAEVHYADPDPWNGRVWLSNFAHGYSVSVESAPLQTTTP